MFVSTYGSSTKFASFVMANRKCTNCFDSLSTFDGLRVGSLSFVHQTPATIFNLAKFFTLNLIGSQPGIECNSSFTKEKLPTIKNIRHENEATAISFASPISHAHFSPLLFLVLIVMMVHLVYIRTLNLVSYKINQSQCMRKVSVTQYN